MSLDIEQQQPAISERGLPNFDASPLHVVTDTQYLEITADHPRRLLQVSDAATANYLFERFGANGPRPVGVTELWQALETPRPFEPLEWTQIQRNFGTREMYTDPEHQLCIHGDGHQDRVTLYAALLGQYKQLNASDMKVLLVAASVHDRARINDRTDPEHGSRAANNFDTDKNYLETYRNRGFTFTNKEIETIKLLCTYHEKPWEAVPEEHRSDPHLSVLIQTLQAADAADRYRSPNPYPEVGWWPKPEFFMNFFEGDRRKVDAFLAFTAYFTLSSEKERFTIYAENPHEHVEDAIRSKAIEVGLVTDERTALRRLVGPTLPLT